MRYGDLGPRLPCRPPGGPVCGPRVSCIGCGADGTRLGGRCAGQRRVAWPRLGGGGSAADLLPTAELSIAYRLSRTSWTSAHTARWSPRCWMRTDGCAVRGVAGEPALVVVALDLPACRCCRASFTNNPHCLEHCRPQQLRATGRRRLRRFGGAAVAQGGAPLGGA